MNFLDLSPTFESLVLFLINKENHFYLLNLEGNVKFTGLCVIIGIYFYQRENRMKNTLKNSPIFLEYINIYTIGIYYILYII